MANLYWQPPGSPALLSSLYEGDDSRYEHTFGGPPRHEGVVYTGCSRPLHMLYNFDLNDPNCRLKLPGARFLPLYFGFQYDVTPLMYRIVSDHEIQIAKQTRTKWLDDFPYAGYPECFPKSRIEVMSPYAVEELLEEEAILDKWEREIEEQREFGEVPDQNDLIACTEFLWQGAPKTRCIHPPCKGRQMDILAVIEHNAVEGVHLWGPNGEAEGIRLVFEICRSCSLINATDDCT